ncbi:hypothetical protein [Synechococcus sp. BA-132 BA5]|uniref:hypothetical protein n=1 Tax=Synechococcus sp. BA-132 BA5 TaxID=3110252 RepID=UPI002B1EB58C|nr:hypothetical protein [Synechococcus sp. BA-132 BA5]MEA5414079.1 hypothetical protein [Synechococcus sp. BA-132 BA5]
MVMADLGGNTGTRRVNWGGAPWASWPAVALRQGSAQHPAIIIIIRKLQEVEGNGLTAKVKLPLFANL